MIKLGTSGFSFPDWKGAVYPEGIPDRDMLSFYENELGFNALEVNFTYYTLPSQKSIVAMSQKTSKGFEFVVKSFRGMTHDIRDKGTGRLMDQREVFRNFKYSLAPLLVERKLGGVLGQFPTSFFPDRESFDYLLRFQENMGDIPLIFEFRNQAWLKEETFEFLKKNGMAYCIVDEAKLPKLMPYLPRVTSDLGYFRFHGRNPKWFRSPISVRYNYLYSEGELKEFVPDIIEVSKSTVKTFVFFNNCYSGYAAKNAARMAKLLREGV